MNCWTILGLRADADERAIKRSYSALLKVHRPDEDLDAFQRLRGAYERALTIARQRAEEQGESEGVEFASVYPQRAGDTGLLVELEQPRVQADEAEVTQAQMLASLDDLAPPRLNVIAAQAKADGRLALFERCLLERCLNDSEQGYLAAQWALVHLGWLTPWQDNSLPSVQLDGLANRLLTTELHGLHALLAEGDEQAFLERVAVLHEEGWLQPFDLRAHFNRQLVNILLSVTQWSLPFFKELCARCGWDELQANQAGWLREWDQLLRRGELERLEERLRVRMALRRPDTAQARAAWLLLKPLRVGQRRRLVDRFTEADWRACEILEETLTQEAPEVLPRVAPDGLLDWRQWNRSMDWRGSGLCLWLLLLIPSWFFLSDGGPSPGKSPLSQDWLTCVFMAGMASGLLIVLHRGWRVFVHWLSGLDIAISSIFLPERWIRHGSGLLLLRHVIPCAVITLAAAGMGAVEGVLGIVVGGLTAPLSLAYADFTTRVGSPQILLCNAMPRFISFLRKVGRDRLILMSVWLRTSRGKLTLGLLLLVATVSALAYFSQNTVARCTWTRQYNGLCIMTEQVP
ncbi:hypothetical protein FBY03_112128 [Pseudomonas sp. SJZ079]|uniref:J domain-containing protein n=1 Tax=Pseudomonas sp. SJZ079 TaxID=2572887 RepID=UPI00119AAF00|nr:J domain-containing protein [Pseudomonas sp. SJZ079]TWC34672.1 hypothetical protein FBY03_112128 [Pseudomonas sp. SJZ079]